MILTGVFWKFLELRARGGGYLMWGDCETLKAPVAPPERKEKTWP